MVTILPVHQFHLGYKYTNSSDLRFGTRIKGSTTNFDKDGNQDGRIQSVSAKQGEDAKVLNRLDYHAEFHDSNRKPGESFTQRAEVVED